MSPRRLSLFALPLLALACTGKDVAPASLSCASTVDEAIRTVVHLVCVAQSDATVHVEYGRSADLDLTTPEVALAAGTSADFPLYGMPADTDVAWSAIDTLGEGAPAEGIATTGSLPDELPDMELLQADTAVDAAPYLLGNAFGAQPVTFIVNREGEYVWYHEEDPSLWVIEVLFARTGDQPALLVEEFSIDHTVDAGQIRRLTLAGDEEQAYNPIGAHHVFTELGPEASAPGTLAYLAMDVRSWTDPETGESIPVVGDKLVEIAPDGTQRDVFSTWDWIPVTKPPEWDIPFYPQGKDWTHANAVHYYDDTDSYLISFNNIHTLVEVGRADGVPLRWFEPDLTAPAGYGVTEGSLDFYHQHDPQLRADGTLTMFATDLDAASSGAVEYRLDDKAMTLTETWRGGFDAHLRSAFLGQVEPLPNGNVLINYGSGRQIQEITRSDEVLWALTVETGSFFGQVHPFTSFVTGE